MLFGEDAEQFIYCTGSPCIAVWPSVKLKPVQQNALCKQLLLAIIFISYMISKPTQKFWKLSSSQVDQVYATYIAYCLKTLTYYLCNVFLWSKCSLIKCKKSALVKFARSLIGRYCLGCPFYYRVAIPERQWTRRKMPVLHDLLLQRASSENSYIILGNTVAFKSQWI